MPHAPATNISVLSSSTVALSNCLPYQLYLTIPSNPCP
jgi:hypothetical protein